MREMLGRMTPEDWAVAVFGMSFFVGVWYAFPMVNTITDVWEFGGGVLRAMEAHTLLPGYGVAYGTLSFYQNYVAMLFALAVGYVAVGFHAETLKTLLILNPSLSLLVPRIVSALTSAVFLAVVYRFLKAHVESVEWRLTLLMLAFGSVLTTLLVRSGKMWMLSLFLIILSFIYLHRAVTEEREKGQLGTFSLVSVLSAFLATANFLFAGLFLVNIPILLFVFWRTPEVWRRLAAMTAFGTVIFLGFFVLNARNIVEQSSGFALSLLGSGTAVISTHAKLTALQSLTVNTRQAIESFPLLLVALLFALYAGVRDKTLFALSTLYSVLYLIAVSVVFRTDDGLALNVRHIAPVGFFLLFTLASCRPPARAVTRALLVLGAGIYLYTLFLLSVPATYNNAYDFIERTYGEQNIRIDQHIWELTLPMNKASYALFASSSCGSACEHVKELPNDILFKPLVVTSATDPALLGAVRKPDLVIVEHELPGCMAVAQFGSGSPDVFDIDINLGRMLMPAYYSLHQLGKNIYIYDARDGCATSVWATPKTL